MLCFDDAALAQLVIAAGRVAPEERAGWLRGLADRLEPPKAASPKPSGPRKRLCRQRQRAGIRVASVPIDAVAVEEMLIAGGLLAEADRDNKHKVDEALALQITNLARWELEQQ